MKRAGLFFSFLIMVLFIGCNNIPKIVQKDYKYEKMLLETHNFTFDIHLENIGNSGKTYNLVNKLIYDNKNFDEYMKYIERNFIGNIDKELYPPMIEEDGTEYFYHSNLTEEFSIVFNNDTHIIFKYNSYAYYSGAAHGNSLIRYFIIDLIEQRILDIDDLVYPIPDELLKRIIESKHDNVPYLRENIWPPDGINFNNEKIELLWNTYTITPYSLGPIHMEIQDEIIDQYLTEKGKTLKKAIVER